MELPQIMTLLTQLEADNPLARRQHYYSIAAVVDVEHGIVKR
jgi:hypothetical protein